MHEGCLKILPVIRMEVGPRDEHKRKSCREGHVTKSGFAPAGLRPCPTSTPWSLPHVYGERRYNSASKGHYKHKDSNNRRSASANGGKDE